jgi:hypothetical protein
MDRMAPLAAASAARVAPEYPHDFTRCTKSGAIRPSSRHGGDWLTTNKDFQQRIAALAGDKTSPAIDESKIGAGLRAICEGKRIGIDTSPFRRWQRGDEAQRRQAVAIRHVAKVRVTARTGFMEEISDRKMEA